MGGINVPMPGTLRVPEGRLVATLKPSRFSSVATTDDELHVVRADPGGAQAIYGSF
jgi:hypothetical protein